MMDRRTLLRAGIPMIMLLVLACASAVAAQGKITAPKKGSPVYTSVINAITTYDVARNEDLSGEKFDVNNLRVQGAWAFASVSRSNLPEAGQSTGHAFLRKTGAVWKVVWSDLNDDQEVGVAAITRLKKKYKDFPRELAKFAEGSLAG